MKVGRVALACITAVVLMPATAAANHHHSLQTGNDSCVVLAPMGGEPSVMLPDASFNNTTEPITTENPHPLHVHVHRGTAGDPLTIGVYGNQTSDPCYASGDYLNPTPE
jgi:hypothetical protein